MYILDICWDILLGFEKRDITNGVMQRVMSSCFTCHAFSGLVMKSDEMLPLIQHCSAVGVIFLTVLQYVLFSRHWSQP